MALVFSEAVTAKLDKRHKVTKQEVEECFANVTRGYLLDTREEHQTDPPTHWFIEETNAGRQLCICFMQMPNMDIHVKTAFEPDEKRYHVYRKATQQ